jgi:sulfur carrier protein ThiS
MWYNKYIGLPYQANGRTTSGIDCWGLAVLVYSEELGIELPSFTDSYLGITGEGVSELVKVTKEGWQLVQDYKLGDLCVFNILGEPTHVGIYVGDNKFLHIREGMDSVIESLDSYRWRHRLEGTYRYVGNSVQLTGAPHPLQTQLVTTEWQVPGRTVQHIVEHITQKYSITSRLLDRIVITLDGIPVPKHLWLTTEVKAGQIVNYRVMAGRGGTGRMILMLAVTIAAIYTGQLYLVPEIETATGLATTSYTASSMATAAAVTAGVQVAGAYLVDKIAPINQPKDPGQVTGLSLFNGATNQANRFGPIPVVLGKVRMAAMLGAQPYIESKFDTSIINLLLVWGFGPLSVSDYQVGLVPIGEYYANNTKDSGVNQLVPTTVYGYAEEDQTTINNIYGRDVTQLIPQRELTNVDGTQVNWATFALTDECTRIELAFNFPVGMRSVKVSTGEIGIAGAYVEIQYKLTSAGSWTTAAFSPQVATSFTLEDPMYSVGYYTTAGYRGTTTPTANSPQSFYRWYSIAIGQGNDVQVFNGYPVSTQNGQPDPYVIESLYNTSFSKLVDNIGTYNRLATIPTGYVEIYRICLKGGEGIVTTQDLRPTNKYTGLTISTTSYNNSKSVQVGIGIGALTGTISSYTANVETDIITSKAGGGFTGTTGQVQSTVTPYTGKYPWCSFLQEYGTWMLNTNQFDGNGNYLPKTSWTQKQSITIPESGTYKIYMSADNNAQICIGGINFSPIVDLTEGGGIFSVTVSSAYAGTGYSAGDIVNISGSSTGLPATYRINTVDSNGAVLTGVLTYSGSGYTGTGLKDTTIDPILLLDDPYTFRNVFTKEVYLTAGTKTLIFTASDPAAGISGNYYGAALRITYTKAAYTPATSTELSWGVNNYQKRKDAFNDTYSIWNLPKGRYSVRVRRTNNSNEFIDPQWQQFNKVVLFSITGFGNPADNPPTVNPKDCYLAKTAIRLQSTNKVNGTVDGINALVATRCYEWTGSTWTPDRVTNNPASLFRYVLTHPANMYAISNSEVSTYIDLAQLQVWHEFCMKKGLSYNNVINSTKSVMDVLREICAAGLASPTMVNGKWSVVIDRPRTSDGTITEATLNTASTITQHFTPHNSWGFESTKVLPKIPDAFRITIPDEDMAYQPYEMLVYAEGKTASTAKLYEELQLPGVTNQPQAEYLAKWHFAQLKLRPETYTLNVDFEYLVCTRGDIVRVSHDVPLWGTGTGRINSLSTSTVNSQLRTNIALNEEIYLDSTKIYVIRIRTNANTSITYTLIQVASTGYYSTVSVLGTLSGSIAADNLIMLGELNKDSQQLVVLSIEPSSNTSAKLTLTDYSPQIYLENFTNQVYTANITGSNSPIVLNTITDIPVINSAKSESVDAEAISQGIFTNILKISITHPAGLVVLAEKMQLQLVESDASMPDNSLNLIIVDKTAGGFDIKGLKSYQGYKFRVRYSNAAGTICGPWSDIKYSVMQGKITNTMSTPAISVSLDDHYLVVTPADKTAVSDDSFFAFEYRVYKDSGSSSVDFWDTVSTINSNIKVVQSTDDGRIDLLGFSTPRMSEAGVQYRVACRIVDQNNNYTATSTLSSFIVKTIVEENPED